MRNAHGFYLSKMALIMRIPVYPPPPEYFIGEIHGSDRPDPQPNPPPFYQNPLPAYHSSSESFPEKY